MEEEQVDPALSAQLTRMVDLRIPLHWLLTGTIAGLWTLISMWFSLSQLITTVGELQTTIASSNSSVAVLVQENSMNKYRIAAIEAELSRINEILRNNQRNTK